MNLVLNKIKGLFRFKDADRTSKAKKTLILLISSSAGSIWVLVQFYKIINRKGYGIWSR